MAAIVFVFHVFIIAVHLRCHVHHFELDLSSLVQRSKSETMKRSCPMRYGRLKTATYLLRQYGDGLLVFSVAKIDTVDGQNGVTDMQPSTPVCRLGGMDLGN